MKLICRLYLPGEGNLKLFGVEAADWNEASSALDFQTEREVQDANYVYCMDHDRVAEEGTPMELLARKGMYYEMYRLQSVHRFSKRMYGDMLKPRRGGAPSVQNPVRPPVSLR